MISLCAAAMLAGGQAQAQTTQAQTAPAKAAVTGPNGLEYFHLFPGFVGEIKNEEGWTTAFAAKNPWGQYTAYLMATNAKGQRTIRIEQYVTRSDGRGLQGTTMYLLEGRDRALLIDTGLPDPEAVEGVNDLKTVVRYILAHNSDGSPRAKPLDFVLANTHSHGDHIGENKRMSDRTVYYMDGDWPANAPANYTPIREGGGATAHGNGSAASEIDLGERKVTAVAMPPHTPGSTGYLDAANDMFFTGDALGSAFVWVQWGPLTRYRATTQRMVEVTRPYPKLAVFGAHFYQYTFGPRRTAPLDGRPADRQYIVDQAELAKGILDGTIEGEPYEVGRETAWATLRSAQIVYSLNTLYAPGEAPDAPWHALRIPSVYPGKWQITDAQKKALQVNADLHLVTGPKGEVLYVLKGSKTTLLIGSGSGAPGLKAMVARLVGAGPVDVVLTDADPDQAGGLAELKPAHVLRAADLKDGQTIDLGQDKAGRPLKLKVARLGASGVTLLDETDRLLFAGSALGVQGADSGWSPPGGAKAYAADLKAWRAATDGKYDILYTARNYQWYTAPAYVDQLVQALDKAQTAGAQSVDSKARPGLKLVKSDGPAEVTASVGTP
jgi:glyoxylase-like metal-dependent hydrolase (beta-lactamase superfamily II)